MSDLMFLQLKIKGAIWKIKNRLSMCCIYILDDVKCLSCFTAVSAQDPTKSVCISL